MRSAMPEGTPISASPIAANLPTPPASLRLHVTSDTANLAPVRQAAEAYARSAGFDDAAVGEIGLLLNEAMANVIRHAYANQPGRPIGVVGELLQPSEVPGAAENGHTIALRIRLRDWGNGVDPRLAPKR